MNITKSVFFILLLIFLLSCNNNTNTEATKTETKPINQHHKNPVNKNLITLHETKGKLAGRYYVENFRFFAKQGFELTKEKPKTSPYILYEFNFKKNGKIEFKDLTEFYDCGNGILSLKDSKFYSKNDNEYIIEFNGEFEAEQKIKFKALYKLVRMGKGTFFLYLKKTIADEREPKYGD